MCGYASLNGIPSCVSKDLMQTKLRDEWKSGAILQSDCCDSVSSVYGHKYVNSTYDALVLAVKTGLQLYYGFSRKQFQQFFQQAIDKGDLKQSQLDNAVKRILLTRFRLGEFDEDNPYAGVPPSVQDSHSDLARKVGSASVVLLKNTNNILPLKLNDYKSIAVIGPFAHCTTVNRKAGYGDRNCYLHTYSGDPSHLTTVFDAFQEVTQGTNIKVSYAQGVNVTGDINQTYIQQAVKLAKNSDITVLVLGLGSEVEREGGDRIDLHLPDSQQQLLAAVKGQGKKVILGLVSAGGLI
eukprot:UN23410